MFRFYRITTFLDGKTYIDFNGLADLADVNAELEQGGPLGGRVHHRGTFPYQDFLIYEG